MNFLGLSKQKKLFYPTSEVKSWEELKEQYSNLGYCWVNLDVCKKISKIKSVDVRNQEKFSELKQNESNLRSSLKGVKIPFIVPPPKPNNYDRYLLLKKWSKDRNCFDLTMASVELFKNFNLEPCKDYDPSDTLSRYYEEKRKFQELNSSKSSKSSTDSTNVFEDRNDIVINNTPSAPPLPVNVKPIAFNEPLFSFRKKLSSGSLPEI